MAKKKKTREQKKLTELKRQQINIQAQKEPKPSSSSNFTYRIPKPQQPSTFTSSPSQKNDFFATDNYIAMDLRKTLIVSGGILALELIVFFAMQTQKLGLLSFR